MISFRQFLLSEAKDLGIKAQQALSYALATGRRSHAVERTLLKAKDHYLLFDYAKYVIKGRWPKAEVEILKYPWPTCQYVQKVVKDRLPEAEEALEKSNFWSDYLLLLKEQDMVDDGYRLVSLLKERGLDKNTFDALNFIEMPKDVQDYICKTRPDLINKIDNLDPSLTAKYQHEVELGQVDL